MGRPLRVSPDRILAAAAAEFSARGFAGARVDRIARRARVNKAMLYYHFGSKQGLYRALLRQTFARAGERLRAVARSDRTPAEQLDLAIETVAAFVGEHAFFPAIMLREVAEGGARLDRDTLALLAGVPGAFAAIVQQGIEAGVFRPAHPMAAYFQMFAPIVMFFAGAPIRREVAALQLITTEPLTQESFVAYMQDAVRCALAAGPVARPAPVHQRRSK